MIIYVYDACILILSYGNIDTIKNLMKKVVLTDGSLLQKYKKR